MMTHDQAVYSFLGLCMKAGKVTSGEVGTMQSIASGKARLVIVSQDASENTRKEIQNRCLYYHVPTVVFGNKASLGQAIGKSERTSLAITDAGLAKAMNKKLQIQEQDGGKTNGKD